MRWPLWPHDPPVGVSADCSRGEPGVLVHPRVCGPPARPPRPWGLVDGGWAGLEFGGGHGALDRLGRLATYTDVWDKVASYTYCDDVLVVDAARPDPYAYRPRAFLSIGRLGAAATTSIANRASSDLIGAWLIGPLAVLSARPAGVRHQPT
jgi:hypothetical protein